MGNVITVPCRSYSAQVFDGCPACVDAALEAVTQAALYVLGRAAPEVSGQTEGPAQMAYRMMVRLSREGHEAVIEEVEADQTVEQVPWVPGEEPDPHPVGSESAENEVDAPETTMRLDDFQTFLERLVLEPSGADCLTGVIAGNLFAYDRLVGGFQVDVAPPR